MTLTAITSAQIAHDVRFRNALGAIARRALPLMDTTHIYPCDLLYDAAQAAALAPGERLYIMLRDVGTHVYDYGDDATDAMRTHNGVAVLRVMAKDYDMFTATVISQNPKKVMCFA